MKLNDYSCPIYSIRFNEDHYLNSDGRWRSKYIWGYSLHISWNGDNIFHNEYLATLNQHNLIFKYEMDR